LTNVGFVGWHLCQPFFSKNFKKCTKKVYFLNKKRILAKNYDMKNAELLGMALTNLRKTNGLTQKQVAENIGMNVKTVCDIENGYQFSSKSLELYMEAINVKKIQIT